MEPARIALNRIRLRDLFTLSGELLLSPEHRENLKSAAGGGHHLGEWVKSRLMEILRQRQRAAAEGSQDESEDALVLRQLKEVDVFCTIVKIGYGKGNKNPVSDLTTFYMLDKETSDVSAVNDQVDSQNSLTVTTVESIGEHSTAASEMLSRRKWKVGVVPQGMGL